LHDFPKDYRSLDYNKLDYIYTSPNLLLFDSVCRQRLIRRSP